MSTPESQRVSQESSDITQVPTVPEELEKKQESATFVPYEDGAIINSEGFENKSREIFLPANLGYGNILLVGQIVRNTLKVVLPFFVGIFLISQQELFWGLFIIGWGLYVSGIIDDKDIDRSLEIVRKIRLAVDNKKERNDDE